MDFYKNFSLISIKSQKHFAFVNQNGKKISSKFFLIVAASNDLNKTLNAAQPESSLFYGLKVTKKLFKKAVDRNKVKRRIRHILRIIAKELDFSFLEKYSLVIVARSGMDKANFEELLYNFKSSLKKITKPFQDQKVRETKLQQPSSYKKIIK